MPDYAGLLPPSWKGKVQAWLEEDCPSFDWGGYVVGDATRSAKLWCKNSGVLAGVPFVNAVFDILECKVDWRFAEGVWLDAPENVPGTPAGKIKVHVATVHGPARNLLLGERVALNTLARCSGIATASRRLLDAARDAGYKGIVAGTRKTTPGFRLVEKYAMIVGGVDAHRNDLSSMIMLKDNHIWSTGSISSAVETARKAAGFSVRIDVEVSSLKDAIEAVSAGADIVMLDNMVGDELVQCAKALREELPSKSFLIESSGGITLENLRTEAHIDNGMQRPETC